MRADRLLSLMLLLHSRGRMTAPELAVALEVSERTIYRDVEALSYAGIPVYTQSGPQGGIFLDENYRISLTGLSRHEIQSLFIGSDAGPLRDLGLDRVVEDTLLKLLAALPAPQRNEAERLRQRIYIDASSWFASSEPAPFLSELQQAVWEDYEISVSYQRADASLTERVLRPYGLVAKNNVWYLVAAQPDGAMRMFRISRMQAVALTGNTFERPPDFDLESHWKEASRQFVQQTREAQSKEEDDECQALIRVHPELAVFFFSDLSGHYSRDREPDADGWVTFRVTFPSLRMARWRVISGGTWAEALSPPELCEGIAQTARAILEMYR